MSHGQGEQGAEDVRQVQAGCGQDKQDPRGARQASEGHRQSRVGPQPTCRVFRDKLDQDTISQ